MATDAVHSEVDLQDVLPILTWGDQNTEEVDFALSRQKDYTNAAHVFLYARNEETLWDVNKKSAAVMMQMRFDGLLGFPGGLLDSREEAPVDGLNRELQEEIGLDLNAHRVHQGDHLVSHINHDKQFVAHFYTKEVTMEEFKKIETQSQNAQDWGGECLGTIRVPLYCMPDKRTGQPSKAGLPNFLANGFAGNARAQLVTALYKCSILPRQELVTAVRIYGKEHGIPLAGQ